MADDKKKQLDELSVNKLGKYRDAVEREEMSGKRKWNDPKRGQRTKYDILAYRKIQSSFPYTLPLAKVPASGNPLKEDVEELVASIVDQKPLETNQLFDKIMKDKLGDKIETYKTEYSKALFGGDKEAVDEIDKELEAELDNLSDEELEYLSNLTDDEIENLLNVNPEEPVEAPESEEKETDGQETS